MQKSTQPEWPESLDALTAASDHHELLFENDQVRVLSTKIPIGERTSVHTHINGRVCSMSKAGAILSVMMVMEK